MADISVAVQAAEDARCGAMLNNDPGALDALLGEALHFAHATGAVDDKAAYMAKMRAGRIDYLGIDWSERRVIPLGEASALLTGRMVTQVRVEGVEKRLDNRAISAWQLQNGSWRMIAFQSTPLKT